ncbi:hypothetical protein BH09VER1_BH09VER1_24710 [soil metagenome]
MNQISRELFRNNLLIQLNAGGEQGVAFSTLRLGAKVASFRFEDDELKDELAYLRDKRLAAEVPKTLSPENRRHRITAEGRDHLAAEGLA